MCKNLKNIILLILLSTSIIFLNFNIAMADDNVEIDGDVWDGVTITQPTKLVEKDGVFFYEISTCAELAYISHEGGEWLSGNYILTNNLIINDVIIECDENGNCMNVDKLYQWMPIGYFTGKFYGNGYVISGIYISENSDYTALFGRIDNNASIDNVVMINSYIKGNNNVGGIIGYNDGALVKDCVNSATVVATGENVGGICGKSHNTSYYDHSISSCINHGNIFGIGENIGGIVGTSQRDDIIRCFNSGTLMTTSNYIGGIVGNALTYPEIIECYNSGAINGMDYIGGICGKISGESYYNGGLLNCYNNGNVFGNDCVGGITGYSFYGKTNNCYNMGYIQGHSNVGNIIGYTDSF